MNKIDIMLISETHATDRTYLNIIGFKCIFANHPSNKAFGGAAIIIKASLNFCELQPAVSDAIQVAMVDMQFMNERVIISAVYCRPRFNLKETDFDLLFSNFGSKFIAGGDFNSKNTIWGSRLSNPKGRELLKCINKNDINFISGGSPTYWPSDPLKTPDLIDLFFFKNFHRNNFAIENSTDLTSDHSPLILTVCSAILKTEIPKKILVGKFRNEMSKNINLKISLKSSEEIETAVDYLTNTILAGINNCSTNVDTIINSQQYSAEIRNLIADKRKLRARWQVTRHPSTKTELNRLTKRLKHLLKIAREVNFNNKLKFLTPNADTHYSLWKEIKHTKQPVKRNEPILSSSGIWLKGDKEKAQEFLNIYTNQFTPNNQNRNLDQIQEFQNLIDSPISRFGELQNISIKEAFSQIKNLNIKKAPGPDQITARLVKILPYSGVALLTYIFNACLRLGHFPQQWKQAKIISILKPGKSPTTCESYRPISILSIFSKLFEKLVLQRMMPYMCDKIPDHQFGFRTGHGTPEQCHRIVDYIRKSMEKKEYCGGVFLDVSKAFDKVWHTGLLYKLRTMFPGRLFELIKSFLINRTFFVQIGTDRSDVGPITAGVPQGSVLGPHLYVIFTADMPTIEGGVNATYADDTAFLFSHKNPQIVSNTLQNHLFKIEEWITTWNIKINSEKSNHCVFTLNKKESPPLNFMNCTMPRTEIVKYLGIHIDSKLTFKFHVIKKRKELDIIRRKYYFLLNSKSPLSLENKLAIYKYIIKPVFIYCIPIWGQASDSNIKIIQRFQNITLRVCTGAPNYISNETLHRELKIPTIREEITKFSEKFKDRLENHLNPLAQDLVRNQLSDSRLRKKFL